MVASEPGESFVAGAFALQRIPVRAEAVAPIAALLAAQVAIVAPAFATLAFEDEPADFVRLRDRPAP